MRFGGATTHVLPHEGHTHPNCLFSTLFLPTSLTLSQERFDRLRYVEVKHGRIAMLAILGHITAQNFRFPGMLAPSAGLSFADCPNGIAAISKIPLYGLVQIFLFIGFLETKVGTRQADRRAPVLVTTAHDYDESS